MLSAGSCLDVCMVARSFAVVLHKCHIFPPLPVWSCGLSGAWPAGPLPPLFWKTAPKARSDRQGRNKMLHDGAVKDCKALGFYLKHKYLQD